MEEDKTITISVDDYQYYIRRDERMSLIEKYIKKTIEDDSMYLREDLLLMFFEGGN